MAYNFAKNFGIKNAPTWCPGCGNFAIQIAMKNALTSEGFNPNNTVFVFDVGCSGNGADKIEAHTVHGLHGRAISLAAGAAIANPKMKVVASSGDGATFSEGPGHLIHAIRNNYPMFFMLHNNENYGLTTGQASALTPKGAKMNATPDGVYLEPINSLQFVLSLNPSFVARTFSGDIAHMTAVFKEAVKHDGFAFVEILQTCPTYNKATPEAWYKERIKKIEDLKDYDSSDIWAARKLAEDMEKDIYLGIFYKDSSRENFLKMIPNRKNTKTVLVEEVKKHSVSSFL
ncbi:thiamine pyrophosphate-dependent enzyme [Candidatus Gracilibacteria bacterium]|nr:thiamine pyrophosphate-dependent enzyme [Candidatus Gracilibacteria bacterium]